MSWWKWFTTAANNATADGTCPWPEGMAPSQVNDSARGNMAALAKYFRDQAGSLLTAGTATAYTVTSNGGFDTLAHLDGFALAFVPHTSCGATVTLNVDGLGAKPLRTSPGVELPSGLLIQGTPYVATYNNVDGAFYLRGFYNLPFAVPIGSFLPHSSTTPPNSNFVLPSGQAISRTVYATYFAMVGTTFGPGDGSTTFNVPDLRGRAIFGLDNMGGSAASRITVAGGNFNGTTLGATGGAENHTLTQAEMPSHNHGITDPGHTHTVTAIPSRFAGDATPGTGGSPDPQTAITSSSNTTGITISNAGGSNPHTVLNPCIVLPYILRVI
jgi:microcystin-dependent protein